MKFLVVLLSGAKSFRPGSILNPASGTYQLDACRGAKNAGGLNYCAGDQDPAGI